MSIDGDDEILQDFLVEAGEILELLSEQLVELENSPKDQDLLNTIFRGFHTVKGGAGFLQLNALVDCCHVAENVFDILRNGQRSVTPELMDVVLRSLDTVNAMFDSVRAGVEPEPASAELIADLTKFSTPETADEAAAPAEAEPVSAAPPPAEASGDVVPAGDITDDEFEGLLDALDEEPKAASEPAAPVAPAAAPNTEEITESEFDALLDQLHGSGKGPGTKEGEDTAATASAEPAPVEVAAPVSSAPPVPEATGGSISESEFEDLLDKLHGKGKGPTDLEGGEAAASSAPESKPEPVAAAPVVPAPAPKAPTPTPAVKKEDAPAAKKAEAPVPAAEATVRVDTKRLDDIMNMVGELVLVRNRLVRLGLKSTDESMAKAVANLDVVTGDLQTSVMKTRMQPIKKVFGRFPRVVRDLARNLKKEVTLELRGEDTDLDKNLVEALADPLVHLVRNSVDHGIEQPEERVANGKPKNGTVILSAEQEGDHILLSIYDDGKGMDPKALQRIAVEKGVMDQDAAERLTDSESFNLIFAPGFSTKTEISEVSGRGVGMDVVKTKINQLNGTINIESEVGKGTTIQIKVPLTLAIMPTLMVMLSQQAFAFPLVSVNEIFHLDLTKTNVIDGQEVVVVREKAVPLFHLKRWLVSTCMVTSAEVDPDTSSETANVKEGHVVVVSVGTQRVGFVVDQLVGQEEVVIKPLGKMLQGTPGMAGATITGDGRIALILDVPSMLNHYASKVNLAA